MWEVLVAERKGRDRTIRQNFSRFVLELLFRLEIL